MNNYQLKQDIGRQERLILSDRDRDLFIPAIENPPELKGKLKSAIKNAPEKYLNI